MHRMRKLNKYQHKDYQKSSYASMNQVKPLIIYPTEVAQWYALINEAQLKSSIQLKEDLESYLVFLLMRFSTHPDLFSHMIGSELLHSLQLFGQLQIKKLKEVGDECLLLSGLFPEQIDKKKITTNYVIELGQMAYQILSSLSLKKEAKLFSSLSSEFVALTEVLKNIRNISTPTSNSATE